jgi:hypothetical protein
MKKRLIIISAVSATLLFGVVWVAVFFVCKPTFLKVTDVTSPWQHKHVDFESKMFFFKGERLTAEARGQIDGTAKLTCGGDSQIIGPGVVSFKTTSPEWWCEWCDISYEPIDVKSGTLEIEVNID